MPFAEQTKVLKKDTNSLLFVVPALLDLRSHLSEFSLTHARSYRNIITLAQKMSANMDQRFSCFLDVTANKFSPCAVAACFVAPSVSAKALIENDGGIQNLLKKAEDYITHSVLPRLQEEVTDDEEKVIGDTEASETTHLPKQPRSRFLSSSRPLRPKTSIWQDIQKYKNGLSHANTEESGMDYWTSSQSFTVFAHGNLAFYLGNASITDLTSSHRNRARPHWKEVLF